MISVAVDAAPPSASARCSTPCEKVYDQSGHPGIALSSTQRLSSRWSATRRVARRREACAGTALERDAKSANARDTATASGPERSHPLASTTDVGSQTRSSRISIRGPFNVADNPRATRGATLAQASGVTRRSVSGSSACWTACLPLRVPSRIATLGDGATVDDWRKCTTISWQPTKRVSRRCNGTAPRNAALESDATGSIRVARQLTCDGARLRCESVSRGTAGRLRTSAERGCCQEPAMRCPHDQSRDPSEGALRGDVRNCVVLGKQPRSSRLSNARGNARALRRGACPASAVTREPSR